MNVHRHICRAKLTSFVYLSSWECVLAALGIEKKTESLWERVKMSVLVKFFKISTVALIKLDYANDAVGVILRTVKFNLW